MRHLAGLLALVLAALTAAQGGTITGLVSDRQTHQVLAGSRISIEELADTVLTDSQGRYAFTNVPPGRYTVTATRDGYCRLDERGVRVDSGATELNFRIGEAILDLINPPPRIRPRPVSIPEPIWPPCDSATSARGFQVIIKAYVNSEGRVTKAEVLKSSSGSRRLDAAVVDAALLATFEPTPARVNRGYVDSVIAIPYRAVDIPWKTGTEPPPVDPKAQMRHRFQQVCRFLQGCGVRLRSLFGPLP